MYKYFLWLSICIGNFSLHAQNRVNLELINQKLVSVRHLMNDSERIKVGNEVIEYLTIALEHPQTFDQPFNIQGARIGKIQSPDKRFNIITFNIPLTDATHKFHGIIQMHPDKKICKLYVLKDSSKIFSDRPVFDVFTADCWLGALYYEIILNKVSGNKVYTLLGSCLNNTLFTNKKIIDVLWFDEEGKPYFGMPIFDYGLKNQNRIIFEYAIIAQMSIHYNEKLRMIIFDHLSPPSSLYIHNYRYYGPDASYDGLKFEKNMWRYWPKINPLGTR